MKLKKINSELILKLILKKIKKEEDFDCLKTIHNHINLQIKNESKKNLESYIKECIKIIENNISIKVLFNDLIYTDKEEFLLKYTKEIFYLALKEIKINKIKNF